MADAEAAPAVAGFAAYTTAPATSRVRTGLGALLAGLATPRVAMAAAAVVVLFAVALPLLLSRQTLPGDDAAGQAEVAQAEVAQAAQPAPGPAGGSVDADAKSTPLASEPVTTAPRETTEVARQHSAGSPAADEPSQPAPEARGSGPAPPQVAVVDQPAEANRSDVVAAFPPAAPAPPAPEPVAEPAPTETKLARIDPKATLQLPKDGQGSAEVKVLKPGVYLGEKRETDTGGTIRPQDSIAPPAESSGNSGRARRGLAALGSNESSRGERAKAESSRERPPVTRRVGGKKFGLLRDVWTDTDYNRKKERPEVTVVRGSDVYMALLAKHSGLRVYFTSFAPDEMVTVVYKDTVYKLVPPKK
ncbi:MAG TPA: hypothetical protein VJQ56_06575 [Blastocatellia bacterium]|nr:hypothetical protein [Blastocatellia bacterium]